MTVQTVYNRVILIVLDGVGIGPLPDASRFGDEGANTLGNLARAVKGLHLPHLERLGLGCIDTIPGLAAVSTPTASFGRAGEIAPAKDSMTGHWEMMGLVAQKPFAVFAEGFPSEIIKEFCEEARVDGVLGNCAAPGTEIIQRLGSEHLKTRQPIVYTSVDSVFQIAAHKKIVPIELLYSWCRAARKVCDRHRIGRVIARPFVGEEGSFERTHERRDFPFEPEGRTVLETLYEAGVPVVGIGKIEDLFCGRGISHSIHTESNRDGMAATIGILSEFPRGFVFTNLVDFDSKYGHRRDSAGFSNALSEFDEDLAILLDVIKAGDLLIITSDHGNDPTFSRSTDHTREYAPILVYDPGNPEGRDLGTRDSFSDVGGTVAAAFGIKFGNSLLPK